MSHSAEPLPMSARRSGPLKGEAQVPGDKSVSHRALILGALAVGETRRCRLGQLAAGGPKVQVSVPFDRPTYLLWGVYASWWAQGFASWRPRDLAVDKK